jgi:hypothetical protein
MGLSVSRDAVHAAASNGLVEVDFAAPSSLQAFHMASVPKRMEASAFVDQGLDRKMVKPLEWVWHPGQDAEKTMSSVDMSGTPTPPGGKDDDVDPNILKDLDEYDEEMRQRSADLLRDHGFPENAPGLPPPGDPPMDPKDGPGANVVWRCVPMEQVELNGERGAADEAAQSGAATFSLKAGKDGKIGIEVPSKPPIFNPLDIEAEKGTPRYAKPALEEVKGLNYPYKQILKDPAGKWYYVLTSEWDAIIGRQELTKAEFKSDETPLESTGSTMLCHQGEHNFTAEADAPGLFEMEKRATAFLEVAAPFHRMQGGAFL